MKKGQNRKSSASRCFSPLKSSTKEKKSGNKRKRRKNLKSNWTNSRRNSKNKRILKRNRVRSRYGSGGNTSTMALLLKKKGTRRKIRKTKKINRLKRRSGLNEAGRKGFSSLHAAEAESNIQHESRSLPPSPTRTSSLTPSTYSLGSITTPTPLSTSSPTHSSREKKRKKYFPGPENICKVNRAELEELSNEKKSLLGALFKLSSIDGKSVEDPRNFPQAPAVNTFVRDKSASKYWFTSTKLEMPSQMSVYLIRVLPNKEN